MKKLLLILLVLFALLAAGAAAFLATFNADRYRPLITRKISETLGTPAELGKISLVWNKGIALRAQDLILYSDASKSSEAVRLDEASAVLRLLPLLQKKIEVTSIQLKHPVLHLIKYPDGSVLPRGLKLPASEPQSPSAPTSPEAPAEKHGRESAPPDLRIGTLLLEDGEIYLDDQSGGSSRKLEINDLDARVRNFSLNAPFDADVKMSLLGRGAQNIHFTGTLQPPGDATSARLTNAVVETNLEKWDQKAVQALLDAGSPVFSGQPRGKIRLECEAFDLSPAASGANAELTLKDGFLPLASVGSPLENVEISAKIRGNDLQLENLSAELAGGTLSLAGTVQDFRGQAASNLRWTSRDLSIGQLVKSPASGGAKLDGKISLDMEAQALGLAWPQISQTLNGRGRLVLTEGILLNHNLLRKVIEKLSIIPGADSVLQSQLPGIYRAKAGEPSTILQPVDLPFVIQSGTVMFDRLFVATDVLAVQGAGQVRLADNQLDVQALLRLNRDLSGALMNILSQTQLLANPQGEIEVPMRLTGMLPHVQALPDTEYLTSKLLVGAAQDLVSNLVKDPEKSLKQVKGLLDKPAAAGEAGVKNSVAGLLGSNDALLKSLFGETANPQNSPEANQ